MDSVDGGLSPRSQYFFEKQQSERVTLDLIMNLDASKISSIKSKFNAAGGAVDIHQFVQVMRDNLPEYLEVTANSTNKGHVEVMQLSEHDLVSNLCELFRDIDVNGDKSLEWEEFTSYIVEKNGLFESGFSVDAIKEYAPVTKGIKQTRVGRLASIERMRYFHEIKSMMVLEHNSPHVKMYSPMDGTETGMLAGTHGIPNDIAFLRGFSESNTIVTTCGDLRMIQWQSDRPHKPFNQVTSWSTPDPQMSLCWLQKHQVLFSGSCTGPLNVWNVGKRDLVSTMTGHSDIVMEINEISNLDYLVSCSLDSQIMLWDALTCKMTHQLSGHQKGVLSTSYCDTHRLLFSAGYDHEVHVWSPFVKPALQRLSGHAAPLIGVRHIPGTPQVISGDCTGVFKIWDVRTFGCLQTFESDHASQLNCFEHCHPLPRIVAAQKKLSFFDQIDTIYAPVTDDLPLIEAIFNPVSLTIFTVSTKSVKIWDALTGRMLHSFAGLLDSDITAACLDHRQRRFLVGGCEGEVKMFNYSNGAFMKDLLEGERSEVVGLIYNKDTLRVLVPRMNAGVTVEDEEDDVRIAQTDDERGHTGDITCCDVMKKLIATGSSDCTVRLFDESTGKFLTMLKHKHEITFVKWLEPFPILLVGDASGKIAMWKLKEVAPSRMRFSHFCTLNHTVSSCPLWGPGCSESILTEENIEPKPLGSPETHSALSVAWSPFDCALITGDILGTLTCWGVRELVEECIGQKRSDKLIQEFKMVLASRDPLRTGDDDSEEETTLDSTETLVDAVASRNSMMQALGVTPVVKEPLEQHQNKLKQRWSVEAHKDGITSLQFIPEAGAVLSASHDCRVRVWLQRDGSYLGTLKQTCARNKNPHWNLHIDVAEHKSKLKTYAEHIIDGLHDGKGEVDLPDLNTSLPAPTKLRKQSVITNPTTHMKVNMALHTSNAMSAQAQTELQARKRQRKASIPTVIGIHEHAMKVQTNQSVSVKTKKKSSSKKCKSKAPSLLARQSKFASSFTSDVSRREKHVGSKSLSAANRLNEALLNAS